MEKSRRGRRPKKQNTQSQITESINTDTPIIAHLPIDLSEVIEEQNDEIFIKPVIIDESVQITNLKKKIDELTLKLNKYEKDKQDKPNKPSIIECNNDSNCWWDKMQFTTPAVEMPESYYNGIFSCTGKFCSWECMMAYNIDINDENISKRTSLIYYMYKKTYNKDIIIKPAPSWKILDTFGGPISIEKYRECLNTNTIDYNYIKPPIISRISYVEKIPIKQNIEVIKNDEVILKRSKPLKTTKYNLEHIIGLKVKSSTLS